MENKNFNISQILNASSVKELDSISEVQLIIFGQERHSQMIYDYNTMIANYGTINYEVCVRQEEIEVLHGKSGIARLFMGKKYDERIAVLEKEIEEIEADKKGLDVLADEALRCIQRFEEEMKEAAKRVMIATGLTVDGFIDVYNKKRRELIQSAKNTKKTEEQAGPSQRGE